MFLAAFLPPFRPCSLKYSKASTGSLALRTHTPRFFDHDKSRLTEIPVRLGGTNVNIVGGLSDSKRYGA
jgi:hypothetical protein